MHPNVLKRKIKLEVVRKGIELIGIDGKRFKHQFKLKVNREQSINKLTLYGHLGGLSAFQITN